MNGQARFLPGVGWGRLVSVGPCNLLICVILWGKWGRGCRGWERAEGEEEE